MEPAETDRHEVALVVNGAPHRAVAEAHMTLADFLRDRLGLTGTHLGCEHGVCGACTVLLDGRSARSCLLFAVQADGHEVTTVEGLATPGETGDGTGGASGTAETLHPIQQAFHERHALQCGFCTPGFLLSLVELLRVNPSPDEAEVRSWLSGNLCRCTGYQNIVEAALLAAERLREAQGP